MREAFYMWLARRLPKKVIFWCFVRVLSSDSYAAHDATALAAAKGLVRWYEGKKAEEAQSGLLPASGAGRRPRVGVEGDLCSTWPGGPNPGVSRVEDGSGARKFREGDFVSIAGPFRSIARGKVFANSRPGFVLVEVLGDEGEEEEPMIILFKESELEKEAADGGR